MLGLLVFYFLLTFITAGEIKVEHCKKRLSTGDRPKDKLFVEGFEDDTQVMSLVIGQKYDYYLKFLAKSDSATLKMSVIVESSISGNKSLPGIPDDLCKILKPPEKCPVTISKYYYVTTVKQFFIPTSYKPKEYLRIYWKVVDSNGKLPICFTTGAELEEPAKASI